MAVQGTSGGSGSLPDVKDRTYTWYMSATYELWAKNLGTFQGDIEDKRKKGALTDQQVIAIWKRYDTLVSEKLAASKSKGTRVDSWIDKPAYQSWWDKYLDFSADFKSKIDGGAKAIGNTVSSAVGGVANIGKYVLIGGAILLVIIIFGRR